MSNRDSDSRYENLGQLLNFHSQQWAKSFLHTSIPGIIVGFDRPTRRARVQIALNLLLTDESKAPMARPVLVDVPLGHPAGGNEISLPSIQPGDAAYISFSERGIEKFKATYEVSDPLESFFEERDAVIVATLGPLGVTPAGDGFCIQTLDGRTFVEVHEDHVRVRHEDTDVTISGRGVDADIDGQATIVASGNVTVESPKLQFVGDLEVTGDLEVGGSVNVGGPNLEHGGRDVGMAHTHSGVRPGAGFTGPPE